MKNTGSLHTKRPKSMHLLWGKEAQISPLSTLLCSKMNKNSLGFLKSETFLLEAFSISLYQEQC